MPMETRELLVELSDDDLKNESRILAEKVKELEAIEAQKKTTAAEFRKQIKTLSREVIEQSGIVTTGKAYRPVECRIDFKPRTEQAIIRRTDTGDIVEVCLMTEDELQGDLFPEQIFED